MMATSENLKAAFAGESQANRKYLAFAKKAEAEGFKQIAQAVPGDSGGRDRARPCPPSRDGRYQGHG